MMNTMHRKTVPGLFLMFIFGLLLTIVPAHSNADGNDQSIENFVQFALDLADAGKSKTDLGISGEWCGRFVAYCGKQTNMSLPTMSEMAGADGAMKYGGKYGATTYYFYDDMESLADNHCIRSSSTSFKPKRGDIVTLRRLKTGNVNNPMSKFAHLAIVWNVDSNYIYLVHGNWGENADLVTRKAKIKRDGITTLSGRDKNKNTIYYYYSVGAYTRLSSESSHAAESEYFSICQNNGLRYPTDFMVQTIAEGRISTLPANPNTDVGIQYGSAYITSTLPIGTTLHVIEIIENHVPGHYWYHVLYEDIDGWFYSNSCDGSYPSLTSDENISYMSFDIPNSYPECSETTTFKGIISVRGARIRRINFVIDDVESGRETIYNIEKEFGDNPVSSINLESPEIASLLPLSELGYGEYVLRFVFNLWGPFVNSNHQLVTDWGVQFPGQQEYPFSVIRTNIIDKTVTIPSGSIETKIDALQNIFLDGWSWNHWTEETIGENIQFNYTIKYGRMPDGTPKTVDGKNVYCGISTKPSVAGSESDSDNRYWGYMHGSRGLGFARMIFDLLWDKDTEKQPSIYVRKESQLISDAILERLAPGDMVYVNDGTYYVAFVITDVSIDYVDVVACNLNRFMTSLSDSQSEYRCDIDWDITIPRDLLRSWAHDSSVLTFYVNIPDPDRDLTNVELAFSVPEVTAFSQTGFGLYQTWDNLIITPESMRNELLSQCEFTSDNDCVEVSADGILAQRPGTATVTVRYGSASASVQVNVLGKNDYIIIPKGVKTIEEEAFYGDRNARVILLPDSIQSIGARAFANCTGLKMVWCPSGVRDIDPSAFSGCPDISLYTDASSSGIVEQYAERYGINLVYCFR